MGASTFLSVDVGATQVTCAQFRRRGAGQLILQRIEREFLHKDAENNAEWSAAVASALAEIARRTPWRGEVHLAVAGHLALIRRVTIPRVAPSKLDAVMAFEAAHCIPYPLEQVEWNYVVNAERGAETEMLVMAAKAEPVGALCQAFAANGFEPSRAVPAPLAVAHAFRLAYPETRSAVLVTVGARTTHIVVIEGGRVLPRTLPLAGNTLTELIADALGVEVGRAEAIKLQHLPLDADPAKDLTQQAAVINAARQFADRLRLEISRSVASAREQAFEATPEGVYLAGGGAFAALHEWLREPLALPVHRFDPLRNGAVVVKADGPEIARHDLVAVVGLAGAAAGPASGGNLLPARWRSAARFRRRQPVMLAIAALVVAALLPPIWSYDREVRQARAENTAVAEQLRLVRRSVAQHEEALARLEELRRQCGALRQLAETRTNWIRFFAELQESLVEVEDVWLDRMDVVAADEPAPALSGSVELQAQPSVRLRLGGRMLDRQTLNASASGTEGRVQRLLASVQRSSCVQGIEVERFDTSEPGILRFEFSLLVRERVLF